MPAIIKSLTRKWRNKKQNAKCIRSKNFNGFKLSRYSTLINNTISLNIFANKGFWYAKSLLTYGGEFLLRPFISHSFSILKFNWNFQLIQYNFIDNCDCDRVLFSAVSTWNHCLIRDQMLFFKRVGVSKRPFSRLTE